MNNFFLQLSLVSTVHKWVECLGFMFQPLHSDCLLYGCVHLDGSVCCYSETVGNLVLLKNKIKRFFSTPKPTLLLAVIDA